MPQIEIDMPSCPWLHAASLPTSLCLLPSPLFRGEGLGVRGFALCFDWIFNREFNARPRFRRMNKSRNRRLASQSSTPHPPTPSPLKRGEGEKSHWFRSNPMRFRFSCGLEMWVKMRLHARGSGHLSSVMVIIPRDQLGGISHRLAEPKRQLDDE